MNSITPMTITAHLPAIEADLRARRDAAAREHLLRRARAALARLDHPIERRRAARTHRPRLHGAA